MYISDIQSDPMTWTVRKTLPKRHAIIQTLFSAGGNCYATYYRKETPDAKQSIARYNVASDSWERVCDLKGYRKLQKYGIVGNKERVYVVGGRKVSERKLNVVYVYDLRERKQTDLHMRPKMASKRDGCSSVIVDDTLYVAGGWDAMGLCRDVEAMSLSDYKCQSVAQTPTFGCSLGVVGGRLVATGGKEGAEPSSPSSRAAYIFDRSDGTWHPLPDMNEKRQFHGMVTLNNGTVVVTGGRELSTVEALQIQ